MSLFLITFFLIYGTLHGYIFLKAKAALDFGWGVGVPILALFALLASAPVLTHLLARQDHEVAARGVAVTGFLWMGFLFFLVCLNLAVDAVRIPFWLAGRLGWAGNLSSVLGGRGAFLLLSALAAVLSIHSFQEARDIRTERVRISTNKLPPGISAVRIAQISDLHLGLIHRNDKSRRVAEIVAAERPDILVSTGDLVDGQINHIEGLAEIFRSIPAPMGKFAVTGNHEFYAGIHRSVEFTRSAGFTLLRNEAVVAGGAVRIAGVDDPTQESMQPGSLPPEASVLEPGADGRFTVLLKHRPAIDPASVGKFDLQLSGHAHRGQIFPFLLLVRLAYPFSGGTYALPGGATLVVSRGTGTWGPPMRFLAPPEITIIDLERHP